MKPTLRSLIRCENEGRAVVRKGRPAQPGPGGKLSGLKYHRGAARGKVTRRDEGLLALPRR